MKKIIISFSLLMLTGPMALIQIANAHHSFAMFDSSKEQLVVGKVLRWSFNNPHTWLYI